MVYVIFSIEAASGKLEEAIDLVRKIADCQERITGQGGKHMQPFTPAAGENNNIVSIFKYETLAEWLEWTDKVEKDPEWQDLVREGCNSVETAEVRTFLAICAVLFHDLRDHGRYFR